MKGIHIHSNKCTNLAHWVEYGPALLPGAVHGVILNGWQVGALLERRVQASHGHHESGGLQPGRRPHVPAEPDAVAVLVGRDVVGVSGGGALARHIGAGVDQVWCGEDG